MQTDVRPTYSSFEEFYEALEAERHISERLSDHPSVRDQLRESLEKLYARIQEDPEFETKLKEAPEETALAFFRDEMESYSLSDDDLDAVAGGEITLDSSLGYDVGYAVGSLVEWAVDIFK